MPYESWSSSNDNSGLLNDTEMQALLARHDAIQPSGDPIDDARRFEAFDTKGQFAVHIKDTYTALRHLVAMRQGYQEELSAGGLYPIPAMVIPKRIEVLDRLLDYYKVKSRTAFAFDDEWDREQGQR